MPKDTTYTGINYIIIARKFPEVRDYMDNTITHGIITQLHSNATKDFEVWLWEEADDQELAVLQTQPWLVYSSSVYIGQTPGEMPAE